MKRYWYHEDTLEGADVTFDPWGRDAAVWLSVDPC